MTRLFRNLLMKTPSSSPWTMMLRREFAVWYWKQADEESWAMSVSFPPYKELFSSYICAQFHLDPLCVRSFGRIYINIYICDS